MTKERPADVAKRAGRDDLVEKLQAVEVEVTTVDRESLDLNVALRPDRREIAVHRWDVEGTRPLWHMSMTLADWGGGDAAVTETEVVTEYDLSRPEIRVAVMDVLE